MMNIDKGNLGIIILSFLLIFFSYANIQAQEEESPIIKDSNIKAEIVIDGLTWPTSMAFIDNNILVLEKDKGTVRLVSNGILQEEPILEVDVKY
jgi:aldose sugar dehydrogenase